MLPAESQRLSIIFGCSLGCLKFLISFQDYLLQKMASCLDCLPNSSSLFLPSLGRKQNHAGSLGRKLFVVQQSQQEEKSAEAKYDGQARQEAKTARLVYILCFYFVSDAKILREDYRIVGTLVGSLPRAPRQNTHLGLPLQLLPEETSLLLEKGKMALEIFLRFKGNRALDKREYMMIIRDNFC